MRKKKIMMILDVILVVVFVVMILMIRNRDIANVKENSEQITSSSVSQKDEVNDIKAEDVDSKDIQSDTQTEVESAVLEDGNSTGGGLVPGYFPDENSKISGAPATSSPGSQDEAEETKETITFPYSVPNSNLIVQKVTSYDGIFLEDGSDTEISDVAAIILKNTGSTAVEYARIILKNDKRTMTFEVSDIAPGTSVVAQEIKKTKYQNDTYTECAADVAEIDELEKSDNKIDVKENEDGSLTVSNLTEQTIASVRLFYKFYMEDENTYVGGITYTAKLNDLAAGGSQTVTPSHYSAGYSQIVMVRIYTTSE